MIEVKKTKSGWIVTTTSTRHGMLDQGGVSGRVVLYKRETLEQHGIGYDDDPHGDTASEHMDTIEWLTERVNPDRVLNKGHVIQ